MPTSQSSTCRTSGARVWSGAHVRSCILSRIELGTNPGSRGTRGALVWMVREARGLGWGLERK